MTMYVDHCIDLPTPCLDDILVLKVSPIVIIFYIFKIFFGNKKNLVYYNLTNK